MGRTRGPAALLALLAACAGCDTTQPLQGNASGTLEVGMAATGNVRLFDIWELQLDTTGDGQPDETTEIYCEGASDPQGNALTVDAPVQVHYSIQISRIPAGGTAREVVATSATLPDVFGNFTPFDTTLPNIDPNPPFPSFPPGRGDVQPPEYWRNPRRVVESSLAYVEPCLGSSLNEPRILGIVDTTPPIIFPVFPVEIRPGETIVVEARKTLLPPITYTVEPALIGSLTLDGRPITPVGEPISSNTRGAGVSFSYTSR